MRAFRCLYAYNAYNRIVEYLCSDAHIEEDYCDPSGRITTIWTVPSVCATINKPLEHLDKLIKASKSGKFAFEYYKEQLIEGLHIPREPGTEFEYTYHDRLFAYPGRNGNVNQIEEIINLINKTPTTRRGAAVTWVPGNDTGSSDPPCMDVIDFIKMRSHDSDVLNAYVVFRSHDILKAWPQNIYAITHLLSEVCAATSMVPGTLEVVSFDAHIYAQSDGLLKKS